MKKLFLILMCGMASLAAIAQNDETRLDDTDSPADSTGLTSINDIINERQEVNERLFMDNHYHRVWGYRSFVNFIYHGTAKMTPDEPVQTGVGLAPEYKAKMGFALQVGRNYRLHKRPIANVAQFNLDFTGFDLSLNIYDTESVNGSKVYNSAKTFNYDGQDYFYTPWNLEKYEANYGMSIGPSITIAPLTYAKGREAHFLKLNAFYHVGYSASAMFIKYDENAVNKPESTSAQSNDDNCFLWGHGMINSFGGSLSWRNIGIGFEHRTGKLTYQSFSTDSFSKVKSKFKTGLTRLYFQIRW